MKNCCVKYDNQEPRRPFWAETLNSSHTVEAWSPSFSDKGPKGLEFSYGRCWLVVVSFQCFFQAGTLLVPSLQHPSFLPAYCPACTAKIDGSPILRKVWCRIMKSYLPWVIHLKATGNRRDGPLTLQRLLWSPPEHRHSHCVHTNLWLYVQCTSSGNKEKQQGCLLLSKRN